MSKWYRVEEKSDIEISGDEKDLEVFVYTDNCGNNYIEIPIDWIREILAAKDAGIPPREGDE